MLKEQHMLSMIRRRTEILLCLLGFVFLATAGCSDDEDEKEGTCVADAAISPVTSSDAGSDASSPLLGSWLYRSFYNDNLSFVRSSGDPPATALSLLWAEGKITFDARQADGSYTGTITFAPGVALALTAKLSPDGVGGPLAMNVEGVGVAGTPTAAWRYSLAGWLVEDWNVSPTPQRASIVGSVTNSVEIVGPPPIGAALGTTGSFQMLKLP